LALLNNRRNLGSIRAIQTGGVQAYGQRYLGYLRNLNADQGQDISDLSGVGEGYNSTGALVLPLKPGGMSVFQQAAAMSKANADAKAGKPMTASATSTLVTTNAQADQIVALVGSAAMVLSILDAAMTSAASLDGSATMTLVANVSLGGIIPASADAVMVLTPDATLTAQAFMIAEAGGPTPLSPEGLAQAVWNEPLADYTTANSAGNMIKKIKTNADLIPAAL
jgi:hypothetical protein